MISTTSMNPDVDIAIFSFDHLCIVKIEHAHRSAGGLCVAVHICCVEVILCGPTTSARRAVTKNSIMERYRLNEPSSIGKVLDGGVSTNTTKPVCHNHLHHKYERSYVISMASYIFPISSQTKGLRFRISPTCTLSQNGYGNRFVYLNHKRL